MGRDRCYMHSNNGEGECWTLGFAGARVPDLTDLMTLCVSVVTMHKQNLCGTGVPYEGVLVIGMIPAAR